MNLKCIILTERCQALKATYYMIPFTLHSGEGKMIGKEKRSVTVRTRARAMKTKGVTCSTSDCASGCSTVWVCQNSQNNTLKKENFTLYKLDLKKPD